MEKLLKMQNQHEIAGEARGLGLCLGLELVTDVSVWDWNWSPIRKAGSRILRGLQPL